MPILVVDEFGCFVGKSKGLVQVPKGRLTIVERPLDGLQSHEWRWLREWWDRAFGVAPQHPISATLVWSDRAFERQLDDFIQTRRPTTHKLLYDLMARGAPVHCAADVKDLHAVHAALLVLNPHLFPQDELQAILSYDRGPVVLIGGRAPGLREPDVEFEDCYAPDPLHCAVYGTTHRYRVTIQPAAPEPRPEDLMSVPEPPTFLQELYFRPVSESFLAGCVEVLAGCVGPVKVLQRADVIGVQALQLADNLLRLLVGNDSYYYVITNLDVGRAIHSIEVATDFPASPPAFMGSQLAVKVPGRGMVVLDVTLEG